MFPLWTALVSVPRAPWVPPDHPQITSKEDSRAQFRTCFDTLNPRHLISIEILLMQIGIIFSPSETSVHI